MMDKMCETLLSSARVYSVADISSFDDRNTILKKVDERMTAMQVNFQVSFSLIRAVKESEGSKASERIKPETIKTRGRSLEVWLHVPFLPTIHSRKEHFRNPAGSKNPIAYNPRHRPALIDSKSESRSLENTRFQRRETV